MGSKLYVITMATGISSAELNHDAGNMIRRYISYIL